MSLKDLMEKSRPQGAGPGGGGRTPGRPTPTNGVPHATGTTAPPTARPRRQLLLVSGKGPLAADLEALARREGHGVRVVDGLSAMKQALQAGRADVVLLLDDLAPDSLYLLAATARVTQGTCKVVALVARPDPEQQQRLERMGVARTLVQPMPLAAVLTEAASVAVAEPDLTRFGEVSAKEISILRTLLEVSGETRENLWLLGFAYYRAKQFPEALELLARLVALFPADTQGRYYFGSCCFRLGRMREAAAAWREVTVREPDSPMARRATQHLQKLRDAGG